jgi:outer membrane protein assembly factor BamB
MKRLALTLTLSIFLSLTAFAKVPGANWPQWRGPDGNGVSGETNLPATWAADKNIKWKTPVAGRGHSSPIVWGKYIFLTTAIEGESIPNAKGPMRVEDYGPSGIHPDGVGADRKQTLKVMAYDANTGKMLWERTAFEGQVFDYRHRKASYASPTAATDGKVVVAYFGPEGVYAYDFKGQLLWKQDVGKLGGASVGTSSSPLIYKNLVIVQCDADLVKNSFIVAFNLKTGKEVWRTNRDEQVGWSSPLLANAGARIELITSGAKSIIAYDPATGKELWRSKGLESNAVPTPVIGGGLAFIVSGYPSKVTYAVKLGSNGQLKESDIAWKYNKGSAYVPSPIAYGDYLYLLTDRGILTALDAKTGAVVYEGGRLPVPATFTASPVAYDGKLFLTSEDGDTFVVKAGPKHEVIGTNSLDEPVYASPAVAGGRLYVRGERNLYAIGK